MTDYGSLLARFCLSLVFLWSGITKLRDPVGGTAEVAALGLPMPQVFLALTILCQIAGGLMVLLGFRVRLGALVLLSFTVVATLLGHRVAGLTGAARQQQMTTSLEHLAIVGGFLLLIVHGAGALSIDALLN
ncbi:MAG TPA: DoxX family protein [Stellaceae bacterium]|nr:DoxX family protein [Stellaceae bacterium]